MLISHMWKEGQGMGWSYVGRMAEERGGLEGCGIHTTRNLPDFKVTLKLTYMNSNL